MQLVRSMLFLVLLSGAAFAAESLRVKYVSDGDSFILESGERVRMIGINAPELADKFGLEAKEHLAKLIRGKDLTLESDPRNEDRDVHGRLLRFVMLNGVDINRQMIADGWAYAFLRYPFGQVRRDAYRDAERQAKTARIGIWGNGAAPPAAAPSSPPEAPDKPVSELPAEDNRLRWLIFGGLGLLAIVILLVLGKRRS